MIAKVKLMRSDRTSRVFFISYRETFLFQLYPRINYYRRPPIVRECIPIKLLLRYKATYEEEDGGGGNSIAAERFFRGFDFTLLLSISARSLIPPIIRG